MSEGQNFDRIRFGLDAETSLFARMGSTLTLLMIGVVIGLIYLTIDSELCAHWPRWLRIVAKSACEAVGLFFAVGLVYVWWRPAWLRRLYLRAEGKVFRWLTVLVIGGFVSLGAAIFILLFRKRIAS